MRQCGLQGGCGGGMWEERYGAMRRQGVAAEAGQCRERPALFFSHQLTWWHWLEVLNSALLGRRRQTKP